MAPRSDVPSRDPRIGDRTRTGCEEHHTLAGARTALTGSASLDRCPALGIDERSTVLLVSTESSDVYLGHGA